MAISARGREQVRDLLGLKRPEQYRPIAVQEELVESVDGIELVLVTFITEDDDTIPAFLLRPAHGNGSAVIAVHQHAGAFDLGKSEVAGIAGDPLLAYGRRLAERGFTVLMPDMTGFEGRQRGSVATGREDEQFDAFIRIAQGSSLQAKHTADIAALTTWILEQPEIRQRVGIMGHSLGGQIAFFSLATDPRISAGVISCGVATVESINIRGIRHNPGWYVPGLIAFGDSTAVATAISGQKVLVLAGSNDPLFPLEGIRSALNGFPADTCDVVFSESGHSFTEVGMRRALDHFESALVQ